MPTRQDTYRRYAQAKRRTHSTEYCSTFQGKGLLIQPSSLAAYLGFLAQERKSPNSEAGRSDSEKKWVTYTDSDGNHAFLYMGNVWFRCKLSGGCGKWHSGRARNINDWRYGRIDAPFWRVKAPALLRGRLPRKAHTCP